jgi:threonylcarbamoyladenosine tRNA methylthiotransferase MtaB
MRGQITDQIKKARSHRLLALNEEHGRQFRAQFLGQTVEVLVEQSKHGHWEGLTDNYLRVEIDGLPDLTRNWHNTLVKVRLTQLIDDGIQGVYIG